ncbi:MAG: hypothetical protein IT385_02750 [Deltaproteobacteria bacterium]|nr:hypothetical protein [Deltaproteobacteria bacterium]
MRRGPAIVVALVGVLVQGCAPRGETSRADLGRLLQRESQAVADARALGEALFHGRSGCTTCHRLGDFGEAETGPNLGVGPGFPEPIGRREHVTRPALEHVIESLVDPDAVVTPGYAAGKMPRVEEPPIGLEDAEIVALATFVAAAGAERPIPEAALREAAGVAAAARAARQRRVADKQVKELARRVRWEGIDPARGPEVFVVRGCATCHGQPAARPIKPPGDCTEPASVLAWLTATLPRHTTCTGLSRPSELAELAAWLAAP